MRAPLPRLYIITDRHTAPRGDVPGLLASVLVGLPAGAAMVQVREKDLDGRALLELVRAVIGVARPCGCAVLVNDRLDVAMAADADGVHLPEAGFAVEAVRAAWPAALIGRSVHAESAVDLAGTDFAVFGPIWETASKPGAVAVGLEALREFAATAPCPVFALGGVDTAERAAATRAAGAHGVAGIRAFRDPALARALDRPGAGAQLA
jgi:thiamine-phosphate pyrophosphorylase